MSLKDQLHIMVVDDMSVSRALIVQALEWMGIRNIVTENDGDSAFRTLSARPVHLVISDYNMPGADGLALLKGLRLNQSTQKIGFILVTGRADKQVLQQGQSLGMNNYITKPFEPQAMKSCIERVVGRL